MDVFGASAETTAADLQLLAMMGRMHFTEAERVLARSHCGEQLALSAHLTLGRMAF